MLKDHHDVLIIGGSISGLCTALAFHRRGVPVTVIERDDVLDNPHKIGGDGIIFRRGAPHTMQPHFFISRLRKVLEEWHPDLIDELVEAGVNDLTLSDLIELEDGEAPKAKPADRDLSVLASRRFVLEEAIRSYALQKDGIDIIPSTSVIKLLTDSGSSPIRIQGVEVRHNGEVKTVTANTVIDASGRTTQWLAPVIERGADIQDFKYKSNSAYYTRHYRMLPGKEFPKNFGLTGALFEDISAVTIVADNNNFVVSLIVNQKDSLLHTSTLTDPDVFEGILNRIPKAARWIDKDLAEPTSPVVSWANMDFFWRTLAPEGQAQVLGYFPVGDTVIRSNPKYGRGCTWGAIGADLLAEAVCSSDDQSTQLINYEAALRETFRAEWEMMLDVDKDDQVSCETAIGLAPKTLKSRLSSVMRAAVVDIAPAVDTNFYRSFVRGYYGLTLPTAWMKNPLNWLRILRANVIPSASRKRAKSYQVRPSREEMQALIESGAAAKAQ